MAKEFNDAIKIRWKTWDGNKIMSEKKYQVTDKWGHILGDNMSLEYALLFMKVITNEYYNENIHLCLVEQVEHKKENNNEIDLAFQ